MGKYRTYLDMLKMRLEVIILKASHTIFLAVKDKEYIELLEYGKRVEYLEDYLEMCKLSPWSRKRVSDYILGNCKHDKIVELKFFGKEALLHVPRIGKCSRCQQLINLK